MRVLAVGDIQGCYHCLRRLLDQADFNPGQDQLWCVGDLVNRGPDSLATLRFLRDLGSQCVAVLGNHDLHLLRSIATNTTPPASLRQVAQASDGAELIDWLRHRPLLHLDSTIGWAMVHAGLHPDWTIKKARKRAQSIEQILQADDWQQRLPQLFQRVAERQATGKNGKTSFALSVLTRSRFCTKDGQFNWDNSGTTPNRKNDAPWFTHPKARWRANPADANNPRSPHYRIVFGHWSAMGVVNNHPHVLGLDSGCVWGNRLTLAQLNRPTPKLWSTKCSA
ncbi:MAG: symmetrical bis(5'-nucleosyl)-tetraphosphatase [Mariprofundales bacterium]|nr:symmetrical bis(5'-nucleosyl)-tetraphosphatase [Mariprofundales bacterium]